MAHRSDRPRDGAVLGPQPTASGVDGAASSQGHGGLPAMQCPALISDLFGFSSVDLSGKLMRLKRLRHRFRSQNRSLYGSFLPDPTSALFWLRFHPKAEAVS